MADIEKVVKGLETCIPFKYETSEEKECRHDLCPYGSENYHTANGCIWDLMTDVLFLLKEQPQIIRCKDCKHGHKYEFGMKCENEGNPGMYATYHRFDWFCADGEKK